MGAAVEGWVRWLRSRRPLAANKTDTEMFSASAEFYDLIYSTFKD